MIKSFSKINLSLRVLEKLNNGLHNIQSNSFLINLCDNISIKKIKHSKDIVVFKGKFKKLVRQKDNTVIKTLNGLRSKKFIKGNYKIIIRKNIPVFSGLGGGTSNAYTIVKYFLKKNINGKIIRYFENIIGSDFRLFMNKQCYQQSLKKVIKFKKNFSFYILIIYPKYKCSTKNIYSKVKNIKTYRKKKYFTSKSKIKFIKLMKNERNDLQKIVVKKYPVINEVINLIAKQNGCYFSRITGSGSCCFGLFKNQNSNFMNKSFAKFYLAIIVIKN